MGQWFELDGELRVDEERCLPCRNCLPERAAKPVVGQPRQVLALIMVVDHQFVKPGSGWAGFRQNIGSRKISTPNLRLPARRFGDGCGAAPPEGVGACLVERHRRSKTVQALPPSPPAPLVRPGGCSCQCLPQLGGGDYSFCAQTAPILFGESDREVPSKGKRVPRHRDLRPDGKDRTDQIEIQTVQIRRQIRSIRSIPNIRILNSSLSCILSSAAR